MQSTAECVTRALRRIGVVAADEPATAEQMQAGLDALNEIGQSFRLHGVMFDMPMLGPGTPLPFAPACTAPFQAILAARLAEDYGLPAADPSLHWAAMAAHYYEVPQVDLRELTLTPSQRRHNALINSAGFTGPAPASDWDVGQPLYDVT